MTILFEHEEIIPDPRAPKIRSGHPAFFGTLSQSQKSVVCKKNKHEKFIYSKFEVAFSAISKLFLAPGTTANCGLVKENTPSGQSTIYGVASENLASSLPLFEQNISDINMPGPYFYDPYALSQKNELKKILCASPQELIDNKIITFFDKHKNNLLPRLLEMKKQEKITFNMRSLASVLATSYTLEEDDFHKGNLGFYIIDKDGAPEVNFIEIDHDLKLSDSIMSHKGGRLANVLYNEHSFDITVRDLVRFPDIKDSGNHYWPSKHALLVDYSSSKAYTRKENKVFVQLKDDPDFIQEKWFAFYKHILISPQAIEEATKAGFSEENSRDIAYMHLITQAVVARQARLRAALFAIPEFCQFVSTMESDTTQRLSQEIDTNSYRMHAEYQSIIKKANLKCENSKNTPLHTAILLGDYRFDESYRDFSSSWNIKNEQGKTPLDIAFERYRHQASQSIKNDSSYNPGNDQIQIIKHLLKHGAKASSPLFADFYKELKKDKSTFFDRTPYYAEIKEITTAESLIKMFSRISNDPLYTLKRKKQLSVACLIAFIQHNKVNPRTTNLIDELTTLKAALNGTKKNQSTDPNLQYICQLRSRLWIIRHIRGLFGGSTSKVKFNSIIDKTLDQLKHDPNYLQQLQQSEEQMNVLSNQDKTADSAEPTDDTNLDSEIDNRTNLSHF